jgi:hypothetical protein
MFGFGFCDLAAPKVQFFNISEKLTVVIFRMNGKGSGTG